MNLDRMEPADFERVKQIVEGATRERVVLEGGE